MPKFHETGHQSRTVVNFTGFFKGQSTYYIGLPGVRFFDRTVRFLAICPVKNMMLNRTISCPVFGRPWKLHEIWSVDSQQNH